MSLSTFSAHLSALVSILESASGRSLVLLDELAAGTDPEEGSALAQALLARLVRQARLTVVTTHYPELKEWASANGEAVNGATGFDPETDEPLYRIALAGRAPRTRCASQSGSGSTARSWPTRARGSCPSVCAPPSCSQTRRQQSGQRSCSGRSSVTPWAVHALGRLSSSGSTKDSGICRARACGGRGGDRARAGRGARRAERVA